jgi:cell volume regulation protein A
VGAAEAIETVVIMLALGLAAEAIAGLLRVPAMIVLVAAGVAFGPEALGVLIASAFTVMLVFITLGASLPIASVLEHGVPALAVLATLIFVARPIAVLGSLLPDRRGAWTRQEIAFVTWARETGVVPASVAATLVADGVPQGDGILTVVALAIVITLLLQTSTKAWLARRLGLLEPEPR